MAKKKSELDPTQHYNPAAARLQERVNSKLKPGHRHAPVQEKRLAKRAAAWVTPGSGNGRQKGDVRVNGIARIECKTTQNKSFSVTREMLDKINAAAGATGEIAIVQIDLLDEDGEVLHSCAVVPMYALQRLIIDASEERQ